MALNVSVSGAASSGGAALSREKQCNSLQKAVLQLIMCRGLEEDASHPPEETHFGRLYLRSRCFGHDPSFMTIDEGKSKDGELCLLTQFSFCHNSSVK